jgi:hypothetical protein
MPLGLQLKLDPFSREESRFASRVQASRPSVARSKLGDSDIEFNGSINEIRDGEIRTFDVSRYALFFLTDKIARQETRSPRKDDYPVLFVNGMQGSPAKFRAQACAVAAISGGPVWGVYNGSGDSFLLGDSKGSAKIAGDQPGNILTDLVECLTDKLQSTDWDQFTTWIKKKKGISQSQIEQEMANNLTKFNRATGSLFKKLLEPGFDKARIVAHSQGNIITCNAVNAVAAVRGVKAIASMRIEAVASPVVFWSEAGMMGQNIVTIHALANDFVAWLGANVTDFPFLMLRKPVDRRGMEGTEVAERYSLALRPDYLLTHNFYAYLEKMWTELRPRFQ